MMEEIHSGPFWGHLAQLSLLKTLMQRWQWDGMPIVITPILHELLDLWHIQGSERRPNPPLQPIPVGALFERVAVDIMKTPTKLVVFMGCLTKWVEVYLVEDQTSETIERLLTQTFVR